MKKKIIVIGGGFAGVQFVKKIDEMIFDAAKVLGPQALAQSTFVDTEK